MAITRWVPRMLGASLAVTLSVAAICGGIAAASPPPGTATQVAALVAASSGVKKVDATVAGWLSKYSGANFDWPWSIYAGGRNGCNGIKACLFGNLHATSRKTIVMLGDSHVMMWLPAVVPWATAHAYKVVLLWQRGCPISMLPPTYYEGLPNGSVYSPAHCASWRTAQIAATKRLAPALVLLGQRTTDILSNGAGSKQFSDAQWEQYLESTIVKLKAKSTKVAVIEDAPWHNFTAPACLAAEPSNVQACSVRFPNPAHPSKQIAEQKAAAATGARYIVTLPWFCTASHATCSSVIGDFVTYWDDQHVATDYAVWLSGVMGTAVQHLL